MPLKLSLSESILSKAHFATFEMVFWEGQLTRPNSLHSLTGSIFTTLQGRASLLGPSRHGRLGNSLLAGREGGELARHYNMFSSIPDPTTWASVLPPPLVVTHTNILPDIAKWLLQGKIHLLKTVLRSMYSYWPHFTNEETQTQL